ncbi:MAG: hypothetical protein Q9159_007110 [Coniocarpon cinnabarinum]
MPALPSAASHLRQQLTLTALPLGLVGIWCMHFVGNAAIILGDGSRELQPVYSPGFSILSAFIPIVTIVSALWISEKRHRGLRQRFAALLAAGVCGGLAIVGMHYTGNLGTTNYRTHADPRTIGGAIAIGCLAMTAVVFGVATLQDSWLNTLKWRFVSALAIATAVPCLHFEASLKLTYIFERPNSGTAVAQFQNVIVSVILTVMTIVTCGVIAICTMKESSQIRSKAEQVVLNCAWFDFQGRIMVTRNGILPSCTITSKDNERGFDDEFNTSHPAFHWLFRVSHDWSSISRLVPGMKRHLENLNAQQQHSLHSGHSDQTVRNGPSPDQQYSLLFRQRFAVAAYDLASSLRVGMPDLGVLYDGVMSFSTFSRSSIHRRSLSWSGKKDCPAPLDIESIQDSFGRGQGLFLTKRVDKQDVPKFQTMDFRFLSIDKVIGPLAEAIQVPQENARAYILSIRDKTEPAHRPRTGVHLGLFALCPEADGRLGPKVIVSRNETHKLPSVFLWSEKSQREYADMLSQFEGLSSTEVLAWTKQGSHSLDEQYAGFCRLLQRSILELAKTIHEEFFTHATLSTRLFQVPFASCGGNTAYHSMITFCIIPNIHSSWRNWSDVKLISYNFFRCLQQTRASPRDPGFVAKVHQEFGMFANEEEIASPAESHASSLSRISSLLTPASSARRLVPKSRSTPPRRSETSLESMGSGSHSALRGGSMQTIADAPHAEMEHDAFKGGPFGGVLVTRDVTVDHTPRDSGDEASTTSPASTFAGSSRRISEFKGVATGRRVEAATFVDELCDITKQRWAKRS